MEFSTRQTPTPGMERQETEGSRWNFFIYTAGGSFPRLLERDEAGGVGGTDAGPAVLHRFVRDGKLAQVVADHLGLQVERHPCWGQRGGHGDIPSRAHPRAARSLARPLFQLGSFLVPRCGARGASPALPLLGAGTGATAASVPFQVGFNARQEQEMAFNPTGGIKWQRSLGNSTPGEAQGSVSSRAGWEPGSTRITPQLFQRSGATPRPL